MPTLTELAAESGGVVTSIAGTELLPIEKAGTKTVTPDVLGEYFGSNFSRPIRQVATAASMAAVTDFADQEIFRLLGYYSYTDGGGGLCQFVSGSSATVDNGFVFSAVGGRIFRLDRGIVNIRHFGAVGDGVTDDTDAINTAFEAITTAGNGYQTPRGGAVYFPSGTYYVSEALVLPNSVEVFGDSMESTFVVNHGATNDIFSYNAGAATGITKQVMIRDLSISQAVVHTAGAAILATTSDSSYGISVRRVRIFGTYNGVVCNEVILGNFSHINVSTCGNHGFLFTGAVNAACWESCYTANCGVDGFNVRGVGLSFRSCASDSNGRYGFNLIQCVGVQLDGCSAENNTTAGLLATSCSTSTIQIYTVSRQTVPQSADGIVIDGGGQITLESCQVAKGTGSPTGYSFRASNASGSYPNGLWVRNYNADAYGSGTFSDITKFYILNEQGNIWFGKTLTAPSIWIQPSTDSTQAVYLLNSGGGVLWAWDTTHGWFGMGANPPTVNLDIQGSGSDKRADVKLSSRVHNLRITVSNLPVDGDTLTVGATTATWRDTVSDPTHEFQIGSDVAESATNLYDAIHTNFLLYPSVQADITQDSNTVILANATYSVTFSASGSWSTLVNDSTGARLFLDGPYGGGNQLRVSSAGMSSSNFTIYDETATESLASFTRSMTQLFAEGSAVLNVSASSIAPQVPLLLPSMTKAERDLLTPTSGTMIYQNDNTPGVRWYDNGAWVKPTTTADP